MINIRNIKVGYLKTNCYFIEDDFTCLIVDPGDEADKIISSVNKKVLGILITHHHLDHNGAIEEIKEHFKCPVYDYTNLKEGLNRIGFFSFEVIYTPGHTRDSISYLFNNDLICGDFIFNGTIGRTDLPTGSMLDMQESIKKIIKYPSSIKVYPGHGETTDLISEKSSLMSYLK